VNSILIGNNSIVSHDNSITFGSSTSSEANNEVKFADVYTSLKFSPSYQNNVGIGMSNLLMDPNGRIFRQISRREYKENIINLRDSERYKSYNVLDLIPRAFTSKSTGKDAFGLIAEEVEAAGMVDLLTHEIDPLNKKSLRIGGVAYHMLPVLLLQAYKELKDKIDSM
jgi:hypothetical protein